MPTFYKLNPDFKFAKPFRAEIRKKSIKKTDPDINRGPFFIIWYIKTTQYGNALGKGRSYYFACVSFTIIGEYAGIVMDNSFGKG